MCSAAKCGVFRGVRLSLAAARCFAFGRVAEISQKVYLFRLHWFICICAVILPLYVCSSLTQPCVAPRSAASSLPSLRLRSAQFCSCSVLSIRSSGRKAEYRKSCPSCVLITLVRLPICDIMFNICHPEKNNLGCSEPLVCVGKEDQ